MASNLQSETKQITEMTDDIAELQTILDNHVQRESNKLVIQTWIQKLEYEKNQLQKFVDQ